MRRLVNAQVDNAVSFKKKTDKLFFHSDSMQIQVKIEPIGSFCQFDYVRGHSVKRLCQTGFSNHWVETKDHLKQFGLPRATFVTKSTLSRQGLDFFRSAKKVHRNWILIMANASAGAAGSIINSLRSPLNY